MHCLSRTLPISEVDISCFSHATENEGKVLEAVRRILPEAHIENIPFAKTKAEGHHGNPIVLFQARIKDKDMIKAFVEKFASNLSPLDKETLTQAIGKHIEKGSFYIRLDKQAAFEGEFKLGASDPIRVRLRFRKNRLEDIVEICRGVGMLSR